MFYEIWQEFDPSGTMYMSYGHLSEMLDVLEPPFQVQLFDIRHMHFSRHNICKDESMIINVENIFQIALPNKFKIVQLDIPIIKYTNPSTGEVLDDQVFCTDILDILTQDFFSRKNKGVVDDTQKNSSAVEDVVVRKLLELKHFTYILISSAKTFTIMFLYTASGQSASG